MACWICPLKKELGLKTECKDVIAYKSLEDDDIIKQQPKTNLIKAIRAKLFDHPF